MIVAVTAEATVVVVTAKVALELPAATVTLAGTVAVALFRVNEMLIPPVGAGALSVTVPVEGLPPVTLVGFKDTDDKVRAGVMLSAAVLLVPL